MHGVFFHFFKEYMQEKYGGRETWESLLIANGYAYKAYFPVKDYPDEELLSLLNKAASLLDLPLNELVEDYGEFLAPRLFQFYSMYVKDITGGSLELIHRVGTSIHPTIRKRNPQSRPPEITTERVGADLLALRYHSPRRLCALLSGMIRGLGSYYDEQLEFQETACMHQGANECVFNIRRLPRR